MPGIWVRSVALKYILIQAGLSSLYWSPGPLLVITFPAQNPDVLLLLNWVLGIIASLLFFASVLAHELSHSLVAINQGEKVHNITLFIFGGVAQIGNEPDRPLKEFLIAFVGPLTSIAIGIISYGTWWLLKDITPSFSSIFNYLGFINIALACFNLVPGFPLDGGRILRALIWGITKNEEPCNQSCFFHRQSGGLSPHISGHLVHLHRSHLKRHLDDLYRLVSLQCSHEQLPASPGQRCPA